MVMIAEIKEVNLLTDEINTSTHNLLQTVIHLPMYPLGLMLKTFCTFRHYDIFDLQKYKYVYLIVFIKGTSHINWHSFDFLTGPASWSQPSWESIPHSETAGNWLGPTVWRPSIGTVVFSLQVLSGKNCSFQSDIRKPDHKSSGSTPV